MADQDVRAGLTAFFRRELPDVQDLTLEGIDKLSLGYSGDMLTMTVVGTRDGEPLRTGVVVRFRPPSPALIEPYDIQQQFDIMRCLAPTPVKAPPALFVEPTGDFVGRSFLVMEHVAGTAYELTPPPDLDAIPGRARRMSESLIEQLAAIHAVDVRASGLIDVFGERTDSVRRELDRWDAEVAQIKRGPLPALERLGAELRTRLPEPSERVSLVHGDAKPGNFGFVDGEVTAVFDWELADLGDPLVDIGYLEVLWTPPVNVGWIGHEDALSRDELVAYYEQVSGTTVRHRDWYRAFGAYRTAVLSLMVAMRVENGIVNDPTRFVSGIGVLLMTNIGLQSLGITEKIDHGPYGVSDERRAELGIPLSPSPAMAPPA